MKHKLKSLPAAEVCVMLEWTDQELNLKTYKLFLLMLSSFINLATNGMLVSGVHKGQVHSLP